MGWKRGRRLDKSSYNTTENIIPFGILTRGRCIMLPFTDAPPSVGGASGCCIMLPFKGVINNHLIISTSSIFFIFAYVHFGHAFYLYIKF